MTFVITCVLVLVTTVHTATFTSFLRGEWVWALYPRLYRPEVGLARGGGEPPSLWYMRDVKAKPLMLGPPSEGVKASKGW